MNRILLLALCFFPLYVFSQEVLEKRVVFDDIIYDPFFYATIEDNQGLEFKVSRISFFDEYNDKKFFFWVRRNSGLYSVSFKNIKRISFNEDDFADNEYIGFTKATLELVTGESYTIYLKTTGVISGYDEEFASPVTFYLHYNLIRSIEFRHVGEYKICPFCGTIYFDIEKDECLYDKTPLIKGVLSESQR